MLKLTIKHPRTNIPIQLPYSFRYNKKYVKNNGKSYLIGTTTCFIVDNMTNTTFAGRATNHFPDKFEKRIGRLIAFERALPQYLSFVFLDEDTKTKHKMEVDFVDKFKKKHFIYATPKPKEISVKKKQKTEQALASPQTTKSSSFPKNLLFLSFRDFASFFRGNLKGFFYTFRYITSKRTRKYQGKKVLVKTTICKIVDGDYVFEGSATNHVSDKFSKRVGRSIAFERALDKWMEWRKPYFLYEELGIRGTIQRTFNDIHLNHFRVPCISPTKIEQLNEELLQYFGKMVDILKEAVLHDNIYWDSDYQRKLDQIQTKMGQLINDIIYSESIK